jgi:hypothetical protein
LQEVKGSLLKFFRDGRNGNQGCVFGRRYNNAKNAYTYQVRPRC